MTTIRKKVRGSSVRKKRPTREYECRSCGWINSITIKRSEKRKQRATCTECKTLLDSKPMNVAFIQEPVSEGTPSKWSDKEKRTNQRHRKRHNGVLVSEVQTHADGTAWI